VLRDCLFGCLPDLFAPLYFVIACLAAWLTSLHICVWWLPDWLPACLDAVATVACSGAQQERGLTSAVELQEMLLLSLS